MSKFAEEKLNNIAPYVPGEQLKDRRYIKLNTNENPFYASRQAVESISEETLNNLNRYSDPECTFLTSCIASYYGVDSENVLITNGSDEALAFAFFAYGKTGVCYPDVTYGFYDVIANLYDCPIEHVALDNDFKINKTNYFNSGKTVVLANPNAQTGIELSLEDIEEIVKSNSGNVVIIDQAYADFGESNAINLIKKYENLLVVNTFSKSRSLAGARVGYAIGNESLIEDLKKVKNSFHPYNVNTISQALAVQAINDRNYFEYTVNCVKKLRAELTGELQKIGFEVIPSSANFVLARHNKISGEKLYNLLKTKGVLVRHFNDERISEFVRITVGTDEEIAKLIEILDEIITENEV